jgi:hypothetical protein
MTDREGIISFYRIIHRIARITVVQNYRTLPVIHRESLLRGYLLILKVLKVACITTNMFNLFNSTVNPKK